MTRSDDWAARLASGEPIAERVVVVVAHPDDESLWTGSLLPRLENALLVHVTDGAPADMEDARRLGFTSREAYAETREDETCKALQSLGARISRLRLRIPDKEAASRLPELYHRLAEHVDGASLVISHPYEGGHPDHDAVAWAVARAVAALARANIETAPAHVEFACYHQVAGERVFGRFWPGPRAHERNISKIESARVADALAAHRTQAGVIGGWAPEREAWRAAPAYDFSAPPPPGRALYDGFGWEMTSARFSALAEAADREIAACSRS